MKGFAHYIDAVKLQLEENASDHHKNNYVTYTYSNEEIDNNLDYFEYCFGTNLSTYKALLFFSDYLTDDEWKTELKRKTK
jgi:hypothetical protein